MSKIISIEEYKKMTTEEKIQNFLENEDKRKENGISPVTKALAEAVNDKKLMKRSAAMLKRLFDGDPVNKNPLTEIPKPKMRLYGFSGLFESAYFNTKKELKQYMKTHDTSFGSVYVIEYLGKVAGRYDVIRKTSENLKPMLLTACDRDGYGIYNEERSTYCGKFIWEYSHGSIKELYSAFRDRGIVFEDDVYAKQEEQDRKLLQMCREKNLFNMGSR